MQARQIRFALFIAAFAAAVAPGGAFAEEMKKDAAMPAASEMKKDGAMMKDGMKADAMKDHGAMKDGQPMKDEMKKDEMKK